MKKNYALSLIAIPILMMSAGLIHQAAPEAHIGVASSGNILRQLPDAQRVLARLDSLQNEYNTVLNGKKNDYSKKEQDFQKKSATLSSTAKAAKEKELLNLRTAIFALQSKDDSTLQQIQKAGMQPILTKVQETIDAVAKEYGYTHIINTDGRGAPVLLYAENDTRLDSMILSRLGVGAAAAKK